jgi:hypothetical protein
MGYQVGTRFCCGKCGLQVIVLKAGNLSLTCCESKMEVVLKKKDDQVKESVRKSDGSR